jgi:hypothetical protein
MVKAGGLPQNNLRSFDESYGRPGYIWSEFAGLRWRMAKTRKPDFTRKLARPIESTGGPGALLETLEDAARFIGLMKPWRQVVTLDMSVWCMATIPSRNAGCSTRSRARGCRPIKTSPS